ncbi:MAG: UDP-N-acetylenolpyruvoylglucosamine reductase, partial [Paraprevotella sp.]|nr:UDP-N-acetylenolpyruvoylglucosamine reductase [Paraprevotella sp.]
GGVRKELERRGVDMMNLTAKEVREVIIEIREGKLPDPKVQGNAGSFFMNPVVERNVYVQLAEKYPQIPHFDVDDQNVKIPAGWLIEQCGWKGKSLGAAGVHDKQALVLVNRGGAVGSDVAALSDAIRADVKEKFGIDIHPEVNFIESSRR